MGNELTYLEKLKDSMMKKFSEEYDDTDVDEIESAGFETILEILRDQHTTQRELYEGFQTLGMALIEFLKENSAQRYKIEKARVDLDRAIHKDNNEQRKIENERQSQRTTRIRQSAKNDEQLPKASLAAKSRKGTKSQTKSRS